MRRGRRRWKEGVDRDKEEEKEGGGRAGWRWRRRRTWRGLGRVGPGHVHGGDVEGHSFEPQHHEEPLGEGEGPDALAIAPRLHTQVTHRSHTSNFTNFSFYLMIPMVTHTHAHTSCCYFREI